ncbi:MAG: LytTR family DNA-binding domain-containing protein [Phascolarctobacterium sp.]|nr:LytTR family DNA-binding domain-containing protein [Phascolarctobacterium sp.]
MIKVVIVDDEFPTRQELSSILQNINDVEIVAQCSIGQELLDYLQNNTADIVFLDIEMPQVNGLEIARIIRSTISNPPLIVFSTGYGQFAVQAFELQAFDYVLKPYTQERILLTIMRFRNQKKQMENIAPKDIFKLPVWHNDKMILLNPMEEISLIRAEQQKVIVSTNNGEYEINASLKDVELKLKNLGFLRTHKSFIVNISKIREIIPWFNDTFILTLDNCSQKEIPVSRHYLPEFKKILNI